MTYYPHRFTAILLLGIGLLTTETVAAATMPAGSQVWMVHTSNVCTGPCNTSNQPGPLGGIPLTTFGTSSWSTGAAEIEGNTFRSYLGANAGSFLYTNMNDTYTVHGTATEPVVITAHLTVEGYARSVYSGGKQYLVGANVQLEIGALNPTTEYLHEQWRITPYNNSTNNPSWAKQGFDSDVITSSVQFSHPIDVSTSHTRLVNVGDVFDMGFGITSALVWGYIDLLNTGLVTFDLPEGVYLTSALGATHGVPVPIPAAAWLFGSGLLGLAGMARRKIEDRRQI